MFLSLAEKGEAPPYLESPFCQGGCSKGWEGLVLIPSLAPCSAFHPWDPLTSRLILGLHFAGTENLLDIWVSLVN